MIFLVVEIWFCIVKKTRALANFPENVKLRSVLSYLNEPSTQEVRNLVMSDNVEKPYAVPTKLSLRDKQKDTQNLRHFQKLDRTSFPFSKRNTANGTANIGGIHRSHGELVGGHCRSRTTPSPPPPVCNHFKISEATPIKVYLR